MTRYLGAVLVMVLVLGSDRSGRADEKAVQAVLDKAIKAMGGAEKLGALKAATWKAKGKINFGGNENAFDSTVTFEGLTHFRSEFEGDFGGTTFKGITVLAGDKGWRKFGDMGMELDKDGLANEKRSVYLQVVPVTLVALKGKGFKLEAGGTEKVGGKAAVVLKVTGPDGKEFKLFFEEESGLPVKMVAKVVGFMGEEFTQDTTFSGYKEFGGIKKATRVENKRDGEKFLDLEITDFKSVEKVEPKTFAEPK